MKSLHIQLEISNIPKLTFNLKQKKNSKLWNRSDNGRDLFLYHLKRKRRVMQCRNNLQDPSPLFCVLFKKIGGVEVLSFASCDKHKFKTIILLLC